MLSYQSTLMEPVRLDVATPSRAYPVTIHDGALAVPRLIHEIIREAS